MLVQRKSPKKHAPRIPRWAETESGTTRFQPRSLAARVLGAALTAPPCAGRAVGAILRPDLLRRLSPAGAARSAESTGVSKPHLRRMRVILSSSPLGDRRALDRVRTGPVSPRHGAKPGWRAFAAAHGCAVCEAPNEGSAQGTAKRRTPGVSFLFVPFLWTSKEKGPAARVREPAINFLR